MWVGFELETKLSECAELYVLFVVSLLFPDVEVAGDGLVVGQGDGVVLVPADSLQEGKEEPLGPDHGGTLSLKISCKLKCIKKGLNNTVKVSLAELEKN